jgi:hypothetical protein
LASSLPKITGASFATSWHVSRLVEIDRDPVVAGEVIERPTRKHREHGGRMGRTEPAEEIIPSPVVSLAGAS